MNPCIDTGFIFYGGEKIMVDLKIEQNERIIRRTREAWSYDGDKERELQALVLTNENLISVYEKSVALFFKSETVVDKKPLSSICIINGILQVKSIMDDNFGESLQILYNNGAEELYFFGDAPQSEYQQWANAIKKAVIESNKIITKDDKVPVAPLISEKNEQDIPTSPEEESHKTIIKDDKIPVTPFVSKETEQDVPVSIEKEKESEKKDMFFFCTSCGEKNNIGARFCQSCGTPSGTGNNIKQTEEFRKEEYHQSTYYERRQEFAGKIIKCPNCGETLRSFVAMCPSCGYELRDSKSSSAVSEFARKLEKIESTRQPSSGLRGVANAFGMDVVDKTDEEKENMIRSFSVPNNKEDIFEFMILAASNIDIAALNMSRISKAWLAKFEQTYNKAKLSFGADSDFEKIKYIYITKIKEIKKEKIKNYAIIFGPIAFLFVLLLCIVIPVKVSASSTEKKLNATVQEIQMDIKNGDYDEALIKANTLHYDEDWSSAKAKDWDEQREELIDLINEKKNEK